MDALQAWGLGLIAALQSALPGLSGPMKLVSAAGSPLFFTFLLPLLYWCVDYRLGLRFLYVIAGGDAQRHADSGGETYGADGDEQGRARAPQQAAQDIPAQFIVAEQVLARW